MLRNKMLEIIKSHTKTLKHIERQLQKMPAGRFFSCKNKTSTKWFYRIDGKQIYISRKNRQMAEQLAYKKYLLTLQKDLKTELDAANAFLNILTSDTRESDQLLANPAYQELLSKFFKPHDQELLDWQNKPYQKNTKHPENLIHKTVSGNTVRSKSEMLIDMALFKNKIPFKYEAPLELNNDIYYPDFTILHPKSKKIIYWEHLGMMDDLNYAQNAYKKLQIFTANGIIPMHNLIVTFETKEHSLSSDLIEKIISHYFL